MPFSLIEYPKVIVKDPSVAAIKENKLPEVPTGLKFLWINRIGHIIISLMLLFYDGV
jgi:hypothetical protein